jgi:hypothetical protein
MRSGAIESTGMNKYVRRLLSWFVASTDSAERERRAEQAIERAEKATELARKMREAYIEAGRRLTK